VILTVRNVTRRSAFISPGDETPGVPNQVMPAGLASSRQASPEHPGQIPEWANSVMRLNNLLQKLNKHGQMRWVDRSEGPQNNLTWRTQLLIEEVEYSRGEGRTKQEARDKAAHAATPLVQLKAPC
jgi:dsRNA-specific ribonuclease